MSLPEPYNQDEAPPETRPLTLHTHDKEYWHWKVDLTAEEWIRRFIYRQFSHSVSLDSEDDTGGG